MLEIPGLINVGNSRFNQSWKLNLGLRTVGIPGLFNGGIPGLSKVGISRFA
jgi:hypothetical protein